MKEKLITLCSTLFVLTVFFYPVWGTILAFIYHEIDPGGHIAEEKRVWRQARTLREEEAAREKVIADAWAKHHEIQLDKMQKEHEVLKKRIKVSGLAEKEVKDIENENKRWRQVLLEKRDYSEREMEAFHSIDELSQEIHRYKEANAIRWYYGHD